MAKQAAAGTAAVALASGAAAALLNTQTFAALPGTIAQPAGATAQLRGSTGQEVSRASGLAGAGATAASICLAAIAAGSLASARRSQRGSTATAILRRAEKPFAGGLLGGQSAFASGDYNFDPLGLSVKGEQFLPWLRESELKHGRICMLAWVGLVVPEIVRIPGPKECYSASIVDAYGACFGTYGSAPGPLFQVLAFCGLVEMVTTFPKWVQGITLENAGDYQLGLGFLPKEEAKAKEMKLKELKNGRLAMLAFGGAITQTVLSGNGFPWLYGQRLGNLRGPGLASGLPVARKPFTAQSAPRVATCSYKMSKAVPFLPLSPALEGYVGGEEEGFDPMGFSLALDIRWLRESELKHGRICMLAVVGWITTDLGIRVPGSPFEISTIQAHDSMVKFGSMPQMLVWLGYLEFFGFLAIISMMEGKTDRKPGDFGIRLLYPQDAKGQYDMQLKELRNGRLAMLAYGGIVTAAVLTGKTWPFFAVAAGRGCGTAEATSVLCGRSQRVCTHGGHVMALAKVSYSMPFLPCPEKTKGWVGEESEFDPLGFSETFEMSWLRESELKHGRVCMLACVGFVAQQYITLPGMTPTPDALQSVYTTPVSAMATLLFLSGFIESASYGGKLTMLDMFEGGKEPGNFNFGSSFLNGKSTKDVYDMKLKELQNGRLAMLAFGGMIHHNLVVKGPLFPLFPEGWAGPQGSWALDSVLGRINSGQAGIDA